MNVRSFFVMDLYAGLGVETVALPLKAPPVDGTTAPKETLPIPKKKEEKKSWSSNFQLMASQLQRKKASQERERAIRGRGRGFLGSTMVIQVSAIIRSRILAEFGKTFYNVVLNEFMYALYIALYDSSESIDDVESIIIVLLIKSIVLSFHFFCSKSLLFSTHCIQSQAHHLKMT